VGVSKTEVSELREQLYRTYGTTLRGLTITRGIDASDYLAFVHDIPLHNYLTPDERVGPVLARYPQRKVIFTNADQAHARRVLAILNLTDYFDQIIDILDVAPYCKPMPGAFQRALQLAGAASARESIFIDDAPHNLKAAREAGFYTIRVGPAAVDGCCDAVVPSLLDLPAVLDPLLDIPGFTR
jgi:putative hydrolase of the HAD superfamily